MMDLATPTASSVEALIKARPGFGAMEPASQTRAIKLNDFIYMSPGTSNAYMLVTPAGRILINTGMGFEALIHKQAFDAICPGPTPYILLTQGHVDHVGGVNHFREADTQLIAHTSLAACQHDDERIQFVRTNQAYRWFQKTMNRALEIAADNPETLVQDTPVADVLYEESYDIHLGGLDVHILNVPGGETVDSALIWLPQHKILFSGNTFGPLFPHFPNINTIRGDKYRHLEPYMEAVKSARAFNAQVLITGHFDPIVGGDLIDSSLARLHDAAGYVYRTTLDKMNLGKDIYELMDTVVLPPELKVGQGYGQVKWAVRTIWEAYMGWFKGQETSELFSTRPQAIYADLVDMAGLDAVIAKGHEKLRAGEATQAQLYAEACLAAAPEDFSALQLGIDAHNALKDLRETDNFWEDGWLNSCRDEMQTRLDALRNQQTKT